MEKYIMDNPGVTLGINIANANVVLKLKSTLTEKPANSC